MAVTRTKNSIYIPEKLMPFGFPKTEQIHITGAENEKGKQTFPAHNSTKKENAKENTSSVADIKTNHKHAYQPWTPELDHELTVMYCEGINTKDMAKHFNRTRGAITSRIKKLDLENLYG